MNETGYVCGKCAKEQPTQEEFWILGPPDFVTSTIAICRQCFATLWTHAGTSPTASAVREIAVGAIGNGSLL